MQSGEVLELMGSAPQRHDTVCAALRYRDEGPTIGPSAGMLLGGLRF